jgi:hypothetical protein
MILRDKGKVVVPRQETGILDSLEDARIDPSGTGIPLRVNEVLHGVVI